MHAPRYRSSIFVVQLNQVRDGYDVHATTLQLPVQIGEIQTLSKTVYNYYV